MKSNRDIVTDAFRSWANGDGYVASIVADDMASEITGRSAVSKKSADTQQFIEDNSAVIVVWDDRGTGTGKPRPGERGPGHGTRRPTSTSPLFRG